MNGFDLMVQSRDWLNIAAELYHYMHRCVHPKSCPFGWSLNWQGNTLRPDGRPNAFIIYASIHYTRLKNQFGYEGLPTRWQVLSLARLWIHPDFQASGKLYDSNILPGFTDRKGVFRSTLATEIMRLSLEQVQRRWIEVHPPRFPDQPYHIRKIISYADTEFFSGSIYRAFGFKEIGRTISQKRHKGSRGPGMGEHELICFVYDLPEPSWSYEPIQLEMPLGVQ